MKKKVQAVIFDMDGVLLDNNDWHLKSWLEYANRRNIPLKAEEAYTRVFGKTNREIILDAFPGSSEETIRLWSEEKEALYREMYEPHFSLPVGLPEFLEELRSRNYRIALASNAPLSNVDFTLDHGGIRHFFDAIVWAGMVKNPKPHPDIYLKTTAMLSLEPMECLVVEDSPTGIRAALAAGCIPAGITSTYTRQQLKQYTPLVIDHFSEIPEFLFPKSA